MKALVVGGTGTVGRHVALGLRERGADVTVLTRSRENLITLPAGVAGAVGDLADPDSLAAAFARIEGCFLATPLDPDEKEHGLAAVGAAVRAGTQHVVYMSVAGLDEGLHIPHVASKQAVEEALRFSPIEHTILRPNDFFQNDLWYEETIVRHGVYPQPLGSVGVSRIDVRDIADAAVNALLTPKHRGETYTLGGPDEIDGDDVAASYSRHLGRPVVYAGDDLHAWAEQARSTYPRWLVDSLRSMYEHFQRAGAVISDADLARQRPLMGHAPRTFEEFVAEATCLWRGRIH